MVSIPFKMFGPISINAVLITPVCGSVISVLTLVSTLPINTFISDEKLEGTGELGDSGSLVGLLILVFLRIRLAFGKRRSTSNLGSEFLGGDLGDTLGGDFGGDLGETFAGDLGGDFDLPGDFLGVLGGVLHSDLTSSCSSSKSDSTVSSNSSVITVVELLLVVPVDAFDFFEDFFEDCTDDCLEDRFEL